MKIVDHCGNSIKAGRLLRWQPSPQGGPGDYYIRVKDVVNPTKEAPGQVVIELMFGIKPIAKESPDSVVRFADFVTVFDPEDELKAEAAVAHALEEDKNGIQLVR